MVCKNCTFLKITLFNSISVLMLYLLGEMEKIKENINCNKGEMDKIKENLNFKKGDTN